jgi:hypothetical protein
MTQELFGGTWRSKLDALAGALRSVHKALIDSTRRDYEKAHGPIANPYALFALVANDPNFAWLQPMTRAIVEIEDRLGAKAPPVSQDDYARVQDSLKALLEGDEFGTVFRRRVLDDPRVAAEHGALRPFILR